MTLIPICSDCSSKLETEMVEVKTDKLQENPINLHLIYCRSCDEYKGHKVNFSRNQEKEAVLNEFELRYHNHKDISGEFQGYTVKIPLDQS